MITEGSSKLASVPSGGAGGAAPAAGGAAAGGAAAAAPAEEEKKEEGMLDWGWDPCRLLLLTPVTEKEESDEDMGFGLFD